MLERVYKLRANMIQPTWLDFRDTNLGVDEFAKERTGEGAHGMLGRAVDSSSRVWFSSGH